MVQLRHTIIKKVIGSSPNQNVYNFILTLFVTFRCDRTSTSE